MEEKANNASLAEKMRLLSELRMLKAQCEMIEELLFEETERQKNASKELSCFFVGINCHDLETHSC